MQMILQEFEQRICQRQIAGALDFHAKISVLQENSRDLEDSVLACFLQLQTLLEDRRRKIDPLTYLLKTLKIYLALTEGSILHGLLMELDEIGYDAEWALLNTADILPQNRERIFIVGHLRGRRTRKIFPIRADSEKADKLQRQCVNAITTRTGENSTVGCYPLVKSKQHEKGLKLVALIDGKNKQANRIYSLDGISPTLNTGTGGRLEPKFILSDKSGYRVRKLTPRECFRLQGFPDDYFDRAKEVCSDSQLYKQVGNSVTVPVVYEIAKRMEIGE